MQNLAAQFNSLSANIRNMIPQAAAPASARAAAQEDEDEQALRRYAALSGPQPMKTRSQTRLDQSASIPTPGLQVNAGPSAGVSGRTSARTSRRSSREAALAPQGFTPGPSSSPASSQVRANAAPSSAGVSKRTSESGGTAGQRPKSARLETEDDSEPDIPSSAFSERSLRPQEASPANSKGKQRRVMRKTT